MSDLVERLRYAAMPDHHGYPGVKVAGKAADEIERLQSQLDKLQRKLNDIEFHNQGPQCDECGTFKRFHGYTGRETLGGPEVDEDWRCPLCEYDAMHERAISAETRLGECQSLAAAALNGFAEDLPKRMADIEAIARGRKDES